MHRARSTWAAPLPVLGVDIGGVIVDRVAEDSDTSFFGNRPMDTPMVADAVESLAWLCREVFDWRVHLVSKAGPRIAATTQAWLRHIGFHEATGIQPDHVHFVRKRDDKAPVCAKLGITHFVDDRLDVLGHLIDVPNRYLFTGGLGANAVPRNAPHDVRIVPAWPALRVAIARSVEAWQAQDAKARTRQAKRR